MDDSETVAAIPASDATPARSGRPRLRGRFNGWIIATALALMFVVWQWFDTRRELNQIREDIAQRLQNAELEGRESRVAATAAQESAREIQGKLSVLEARIAEARGQQTALEQLYQELSRSRDESVLTEIEQILSIASQQLQLAGNVQGALLALQSADARLARSDRPQFIPVRRVIARDIDRLKALPNIDLTGLVLKLDQVSAGIDRFPLVGDMRLSAPEGASAIPDNPWSRVASVVWGELRQLIRVERVDGSEPALLIPEQSYFLRENLKLRLLNARLALLQRNEAVFKADLKMAAQWISKYFDTRQKGVAAVSSTLQELQSAGLTVELPTLADSLAAVRNFKAHGDKP
jgi:uroporphyrin-3 C-methyltransferase